MTTSLNIIAFKAQTHLGIDGITMPKYKVKLTENIDRLGQQLK